MTCSQAVRIGIALLRHTVEFDVDVQEVRPRRTIRGARAGACHVTKEMGVA